MASPKDLLEDGSEGDNTMNFRWTIKELETFTNKRMIQGLITERKAGLNPYAPLYVRLTKLSHWVEKHVRG